MWTDVRLVAGLLTGLLWMTPFGVAAQPASETPAARPTEREANGRTGKPPDAAKPPDSAKPQAGTPKPAKKPSKAFQPSDKIPADVPSTFPTDI